MERNRASARVNIKALMILVIVFGGLGAGAFGFHQVRKRMRAQHAHEVGMAAFENKDWETASVQLRRYLSQYPDDQNTLDTFVEASLAVRPFQDKFLGDAIAGLVRIRRNRPDDSDVMHQLIELYSRTNNFEDAIYLGELGISSNPDDPQISYHLAKAWFGVGRMEEAQKLLERIVTDLDPALLDAYRVLLAVMTEQSNADVNAAGQWLDLCVNNNPNSPEAHILRAIYKGNSYQGRKSVDVEAARLDLEAAEALATEDALVRMTLAEQWLRLRSTDRVAAHLTEIESTSDDFLYENATDPHWFRFRLLVNWAELARIRADADEMLAIANRGLKELEGNIRSTFLRNAVELYIAADDYEQAEKCLLEYRRYADSSARLKSELSDEVGYLSAQLATVQNRPFDAINLLEDVAARNPRNPAPALLLARAYSDSGQPRLSIRTYQQLLNNVPSHLMATSRLAREQLRVGEWGEALRYAQLCEELTGGRLDCLLMRMEAEARMAIGKSDQPQVFARLSNELGQLRDAFPDAFMIPLLESMIAIRGNRLNDAVTLLQTSASLPGATDDVTIRLARVLAQTGRTGDAVQVCRDYLREHPESSAVWLLIATIQQSGDQPGQAEATLISAEGRVTSPMALRDIRVALARREMLMGDREKGIDRLKTVAVDNLDDVLVRAMLLELPEIIADRELAGDYVTQIREIEGENGLRWRIHQARVWMTDDKMMARREQIEKLLGYCIEADANWIRPAIMLGRVHEVTNELGRAEQVYRATLQANPRSIQTAEKLLALLQTQGRDTESEDILANLPGDSTQLARHRIDLAIKRGDLAQAIAGLETAVADDARDVRARLLLARLVYRENRDAQRVMSLLREVEEIVPNEPEVIALRAFVMSTEGRDDDALAMLDEKVELRKDYESHFIRGEFHAARGHDEQAEMDFVALTQFEDRGAAGWDRLGRFYHRRGRNPDAIRAWRKSASIDPDRLTAKRSLIGALMDSGDETMQEEGAALLADVERDHPDDSDVQLLSARVLLRTGDPRDQVEAKHKLLRVIETDPKAITAFLLLVQIALAGDDTEEAGDYITRALASNPNHPDLFLARANIEMALNNTAAARRFAESAIERDPKRRTGYVMLFEIERAKGHRSTALEIADRALEVLGDDVYFTVRKAELLADDEQMDEAISGLQAFADQQSGENVIPALLLLADLHCKNGDVTTFQNTLASAVKAGANETLLFVHKVSCLGATRADYNAVQNLLMQRRASAPDDHDTLMFAARILGTSPAPAHQALFREVVDFVADKDATNVDARLALAQIAYAVGNHSEAIEYYRAAYDIEPTNVQVLNDLAWVLAESGTNKDEALSLATRGVELNPNDPHLRDTRGYILSELERHSEAATELAKAVELSDDAPGTKASAYLKLARAYVGLGSKAATRSALRNAKAIDDETRVLSEKDRRELNELLRQYE